MKAQRASSSGKIESPYFSISPTKCNCEAWTLDTKQTYEDSERWEEGRPVTWDCGTQVWHGGEWSGFSVYLLASSMQDLLLKKLAGQKWQWARWQEAQQRCECSSQRTQEGAA